MGGKLAMYFALCYPDKVNKLIVVDMAPVHHVSALQSSLFALYCQEMLKVQKSNVQSKTEADLILKQSIPELSIRQFLLTNLKKSPNGHWQFRINLPILQQYLSRLWEFPIPQRGMTFDKKVLFIAGSKANYITSQHHELIYSFFPNATIDSIDAGHW